MKSAVRYPAICALALWFFGSHAAPSAEEKAAQPQTTPVDIQMRNVNFRLTPAVVIEIRSLRGQLRRTKPEVPVTFDDSASFLVDIDSADVAMTPASMTALMNTYVLAYEGSPIKNITVEIRGNRLVQKGTVHKGVDLLFEMEGSLSPTADGEIRVHADKIKAGHLPVKGLLHLLGEDLSKVMNSNSARGMRVEGDDIILIPRSLTPPPHMEGRVTRVGIEGGKIVQHFDAGRHLPALKPSLATNAYIYHRNGILRFGKLTMNDADLEIVGDRPGAFEFFQREYQKQLIAGYSKNTAAGGLVSHMVDYTRVRSHASSARALTAAR